MNPDTSSELRDKMVSLIEEKFKNIKRNNGGPYSDHLYAVEENALNIARRSKWAIMPNYLSLVALGHDLIEDTDVTFEDLEKQFGPNVAADILLLSRPKKMNYFDYIYRLAESRRIVPITVKLGDLEHNMSDSPEGSRKDKYRFAHHFLTTTTYTILLS